MFPTCIIPNFITLTKEMSHAKRWKQEKAPARRPGHPQGAFRGRVFANRDGKRPRPRRGGGGEGKGGDPCGRPRPSIERDEGAHKGPHSTTQPLPPLRG